MNIQELFKIMLAWQRELVLATTMSQLLVVSRKYRDYNNLAFLREGVVERSAVVVHVPRLKRSFLVEFVNQIQEDDRRFVAGLVDAEQIGVSGWVEHHDPPRPPNLASGEVLDRLRTRHGSSSER